MKSEGVRRLSILLGFFGAIAWIIFIIIVTNFFASKEVKLYSLAEWLIIVCGLGLGFLLPFAITKGIAWVIEGFKQDKGK